MPRTILLADDSLAVHRAVEKAFRDRDDEIVVTSSGDEAIEEIERRLPDIVLADIHMPGASGYEVATQAKNASADLPVLLLVGTFEPLEEERVSASGADGHLLKPFDASELVERVDALTGVEAPEPVEAPPEEPESPEEEAVESAAAEETERVESRETEEEPSTEEESGAQAPEGEATEEEATEAEERGSVEEPIDADESESVEPTPSAVRLAEADIERIARRVVEQLSTDVVERLARELLPEIAEAAVRRRIEELEQDVE